jgi:hypothetical protein
MSEQQANVPKSEKIQRILALFDRLLPLVDGVADKLRFLLIVGVLLLTWIGIWLAVIKKYTLVFTVVIVGLALLPLLILLRFWWSLEELKDLPNIVGQMAGDAKQEFQESVQTIRTGNVARLSFLTAGRGLWSLGSMLRESRELVGSYISIAALINPFMLILGVMSLGFVLFLLVVAIVLVFLSIF